MFMFVNESVFVDMFNMRIIVQLLEHHISAYILSHLHHESMYIYVLCMHGII